MSSLVLVCCLHIFLCVVFNVLFFLVFFFFFKQKTAYEMRISDWSSDVCSSDLEQLFMIAEQEARFGALCPQVDQPVDHLRRLRPAIDEVAQENKLTRYAASPFIGKNLRQ